MSSVCPFAKAGRPSDGCPVKHDQRQLGTDNKNERPGVGCPVKHDQQQLDTGNKNERLSDGCPVKHDQQQLGTDNKNEHPDDEAAKVPPKCPFGYDSHTFKLGPLSCVICQALLFESSKCIPCSHKYCKLCISRFKDCPICGADIEGIESDADLQAVVDRFIDGHCRIKRSQITSDTQITDQKNVIYEDVSMERGAFLVQQALRAFRAQNMESAKSRLVICAEDIKEQIDKSGSTSEACSQLGAVLGMLGDCCRVMGDPASAVSYYEESVEFLFKLPTRDKEVVHTLSVSLNKIGDLKYYEGDLKSARVYYARSLEIRQNFAKEQPNISTQMIDIATSLAKVADVNRNLGNENDAINGFQEAIKCLESLKLAPSDTGLERKRQSVLEFLNKQVEDKSSPEAAAF